MTLVIMQPYLFPYIGYWQLIANSDEFIFFDVVQYNKRSWMNRNRILHPDKSIDFQYISVPIKKHDKGTLISNAILNNDEKWKAKIIGQLSIYKKLRAPYYNEILTLINSIFSKDYHNLLDLSVESTKIICNYLDINLKYKVASEIEFDREIINDPGDWALSISKEEKATHYINPHGGYEIFDEDKYNQNNINLKFIKSNLTPYKQSMRENFQAGLSIIDIMMFNSKEEIRTMLYDDFIKLTKKDLMELE
jgi:hypothetical protein